MLLYVHSYRQGWKKTRVYLTKTQPIGFFGVFWGFFWFFGFLVFFIFDQRREFLGFLGTFLVGFLGGVFFWVGRGSWLCT
jgi:hypothetical protein